MKKFKLALFIFRRDLRLFDNTGLITAAKQSQMIIPCFIFDPKQSQKNNKFFSHNCFQFMIESLKCLDNQLKKRQSQLYMFQGNPNQVISQIINQTKADALFLNKDYTPYSVARDHKINRQCKQKEVHFYSEEDSLLIPFKDLPEKFQNYKKFTPFYKRLSQQKIKSVNKFDKFCFYNKKIASTSSIPEYQYNKNVPINGGRSEGLKLLHNLPANYANTKNQIGSHNSNLSAHNKFGTISIRQFYYATKDEQIRRQLFWRQFYYHILVDNNGFSCFQKKFENIEWKGNPKHLQLWKKGNTGVPIVDAAMRELMNTGMMHNRLRLIVGSFLVKDLLIDWKEGELHFSHYLVDYDPAQNNGNWQWVASTGVDSQPYFRIFNPRLQSQTYDPQCQYIKKWIPQLNKVPKNSIHNWESEFSKYEVDYPKPIVNHAQQKAKALELYKSYAGGTKDSEQQQVPHLKLSAAKQPKKKIYKQQNQKKQKK